MTESADAPADRPPAREVVARASHEGISVRKVATMHGAEAVAVYFSIRSIREDRCTIRIADAIPEPLRGKEVEFHPKYDPVNWTLTDGTAVYAATIPPDSSRTTVYGVLVDDPGQLQLFEAAPSLEITDSQAVGSGGAFAFKGSDAPPESDAPGTEMEAPDTGPGPVEAEDREGRDRDDEGAGEPDYGPYFDGPGIEVDGSEDFGLRPARSGTDERDSVVDRLVSEVRRRDLTEAERAALREALGFEGDEGADRPLEELRDEVAALRDEVDAADRQSADIDGLESRMESLATELEAVQDALSREVRWRSQLRDSLDAEPEPADPDRG